jgi:AraC-like DNA-binding protein
MTPSALDVQRVAAALEVMISKVDRDEPFALAVDEAEVGRRQLERHFKALRTTPHKEQCRIRSQLAGAELTSKRGSSSLLRGIARRVGYRSERRLREAMQDTFGLSPGEIRRAARLDRNLKTDEAIRAQWRGTGVRIGLWSEYRRRRTRETFQRLLSKANPTGANLVLGYTLFPRCSRAREEAGVLARARVRELYAEMKASLKDAA